MQFLELQGTAVSVNEAAYVLQNEPLIMRPRHITFEYINTRAPLQRLWQHEFGNGMHMTEKYFNRPASIPGHDFDNMKIGVRHVTRVSGACYRPFMHVGERLLRLVRRSILIPTM